MTDVMTVGKIEQLTETYGKKSTLGCDPDGEPISIFAAKRRCPIHGEIDDLITVHEGFGTGLYVPAGKYCGPCYWLKMVEIGAMQPVEKVEDEGKKQIRSNLNEQCAKNAHCSVEKVEE